MRPKIYGKRTTTAIRIDPKLLKRLKHEALERDVSVSYIICRLVEEWLGRMDREKQVIRPKIKSAPERLAIVRRATSRVRAKARA